MRKLLIIPVLLFLYSCTPASNGYMHQDDKGCTILTNTSTSAKINFTLEYPTVDYKWEQVVPAGGEAILGCSEEAKTIIIVGASIKN